MNPHCTTIPENLNRKGHAEEHRTVKTRRSGPGVVIAPAIARPAVVAPAVVAPPVVPPAVVVAWYAEESPSSKPTFVVGLEQYDFQNLDTS